MCITRHCTRAGGTVDCEVNVPRARRVNLVVLPLKVNESVRFLLFPLIAVVGWFLSRRNDEFARRVVRVLSVIVALLFVIIVASGWLRPQPAAFSAHKWASHGFVITMWLFVPFSLGAALQMNLRRRPGVATAQIIVLLLLLAVGLLASFTGYLAPSGVEDIPEETKNRFVVLHLFAAPSLIAILLVAWWFLFGPYTRLAAEPIRL